MPGHTVPAGPPTTDYYWGNPKNPKAGLPGFGPDTRQILRIKELHFDPSSVRALEERLRDYLANNEGITVPEFKEMAGLSRKYVIPLIEHFDESKVTLRVGERRFLRKPLNGQR